MTNGDTLNVPVVEKEYDLLPAPRVLRMLGEITLEEWRCIAELIDNSVDAFLAALREGSPVDDPEVRIMVPTADIPQARITIRDNAHGMDSKSLENAVRAGWTSNDSVNNLGLFGMGFNIATARLGLVTTVWTSRPGDTEECGVRIDFPALQRSKTFRTPELRRPKIDPQEHGTTVEIEQLKPDQRAWFSKTANIALLRKMLGRSYAPMLRASGAPISFRLSLNGKSIQPHLHCVWDESRTTTVQGQGLVSAVQTIDHHLPARPYCDRCWMWLHDDENVCPECELSDAVISRTRHVHGWLGIQRYLSKDEYGIDFVRNGRKIELANTDLFYWSDGATREPEYPIDDPSRRGRIVGEIHVDHCRVNYTKDRFDRNDPAWTEMVRIIRGSGPLRPEKAGQLGYPANTSPLFLLYQAFRRSNPRPKVAGCWAKLLVVPNNDTATDYANRFYKGEPDFQTDEKWWQLVAEADAQLLVQSHPTPPPAVPEDGAPTASISAVGIPGFGGNVALPIADSTPSTSPNPAPSLPEPVRARVATLSQEYRDSSTQQRWKVEAFRSSTGDPDLVGGRPWALTALPSGTKRFVFNADHAVFRSMTMTPLDALLAELGYRIMDAQRGTQTTVPFDLVLSGLRNSYASAFQLDATTLVSDAAATLQVVCRRVGNSLDPADAVALFDELGSHDQEAILGRMATRSVRTPQDVIAGGKFLEFAPRRTTLAFYDDHPELFFDGKCFEEAYSTLTFPNEKATHEARRIVSENYRGLLHDVAWLADQDPADLGDASRERLMRCMLAVEILSLSTAEGAGS